MVKTVGFSPKVYLPVFGQIVVGVILLLAGNDVEGKTLLISAAASFGVGAAASPGDVITTNPGIDSEVG
jgi:hypothetical protein